MNNPNQHITEFLNYYCNLSSPQYAVLLKGKWGSGKTHFINEYKNVLKENNKKYIYVSLYGVTSYDEIETKFLEVLHPKLYNKKTILAGKIAKGFLKATLKVDLDDDDKPDGTVSGQVPNLDAGDLLNTKDYILIFDDLERCSIDINDLLGYINYFVEHQDYSVILLANDEKFKSDEYHEIKEKLIGKTFEVVSNTDLAYDSFIKDIKDNNVFMDYKENIIRIYKQSNYNNLRVFRQVILDFYRLYKSIELVEFKKELVKDFVTEYFIFAIENRFQSYTIYQLKKSKNEQQLSFKMNDESTVTKKENLYAKFIVKYESLISEPYRLPFEIWNDILNSSIIDKKTIMKIFYKSKYYFDENTPSWIKLQNFTSIKDEEFKILLSDVALNMKNKEYTTLDEILTISTLLLKLQDDKLYVIEKEELLKLIYQNIDFIFEQNHLTEDDFSLEKKLSRKTFNKHDKVIYNYYEKKENKYYKEKMEQDSLNIVKYLKEKDNKIYELLSSSNNKSNYKDKSILNFVNIQELINILVLNETNSSYFFGSILNDRYTNYAYNDNLVQEISFLKELEKEIKEEYKKRLGKVSGYNLDEYFLKSALPKAINDLETYINNNKESKS